MNSLPTIISLLSAQEKLLEYKAYDCYRKSQQHLKILISEMYESAQENGTISDFLKKDLPIIKARIAVISAKIEKEASFLEGYFSRVLNRPTF